jgi:BirA family transcriptional regulator, biotin operon repressor / biotin---[acetyl-CoA-carboxylase] ligase
MSFERSRATGAAITVVDRTGSTNADLLAVAADTPHLGALVTLDQTSGRGRLDRTWTVPAGQALAASVLVRAELDPATRAWLPLVAGTAMQQAVRELLPDRAVGVKWPNDVLVDGRKVCGVLAQVAPDGSVVVGAGVNLTIPADELPTPVSTSLVVEGADGTAEELADAVLAVFLESLRDAVDALAGTDGGAGAAGVFDTVRAACETIGRVVRLELPDGTSTIATAVGIDDDGRLVVTGEDGARSAISVGDVTHLRYA